MEVRQWEALPGVRAFLAPLGGVAPEEWEALYCRMDPQRQIRCRRYARPQNAKRCILADALARHAIEVLSHRPGGELHFSTRPGGKPYVPGLALDFSLSHSGELVLCAAAPFPVGADLQRARPVSPALTRHLARAGYQGQSQDDFFRWWVEQEATGKLTGHGLRLSPLPRPGLCRTETLEELDGVYWYCVCAQPPQGA